MPRTATTVTVLAPAGWPRSTWSGSQGERASFSAKQHAILPGHACVDFSMPSGFAPPRLRMTRRSARPIVAFALMFPPKHAVPPLIPSRPAIGPLTMMIGAAPIIIVNRSEEHTSELQSRPHLVCRLLLEKKQNIDSNGDHE